MNKNCLLCGVGGQGVVLASKLIAGAALNKGYFVRTTETIGMSQRGGSVVSHVRMGEEIHSPMIPKGQADIILAFEPAEAVRNLDFLKPGGIVVVNRKTVKPVTSTLGQKTYDGEEMIRFLEEHTDHLLIVDGEEACREAGSPKVLNAALLGAAVESKALPVTMDEMRGQLAMKVKPAFIEMNERALMAGARQAKEIRN